MRFSVFDVIKNIDENIPTIENFLEQTAIQGRVVLTHIHFEDVWISDVLNNPTWIDICKEVNRSPLLKIYPNHIYLETIKLFDRLSFLLKYPIQLQLDNNVAFAQLGFGS